MGKTLALAFLLALSAACERSPTEPSESASLRVQVVDDLTREPITSSIYRLELQLAGSGKAYNQPVVNGLATFRDVAHGEYRLSTAALFGYLQLDVVTITIDGAQNFTLELAPIDDFGVDQISVDGQGVIPAGGTIAIPMRGVTLRMKGKYQSPRSPWPAKNTFSVTIPSLDPQADGFGHEGGRTESGPTSANDFEITIPNWTPCSLIVDGRLTSCYTSADTLMLTMSTPSDRGVGGTPLIRKYQKWPLKFDLVPGCCLP